MKRMVYGYLLTLLCLGSTSIGAEEEPGIDSALLRMAQRHGWQ